jgi:hypothetical protein
MVQNEINDDTVRLITVKSMIYNEGYWNTVEPYIYNEGTTQRRKFFFAANRHHHLHTGQQTNEDYAPHDPTSCGFYNHDFERFVSFWGCNSSHI